MIRSQIPKFRLPEEIIDEEVGYIERLGVETRYGTWINSLKSLLDEGYDAVFVGSGAPRGRELDVPGRREAAAHIHIGIDWLSSVSFGHVTGIGQRVLCWAAATPPWIAAAPPPSRWREGQGGGAQRVR